MKAYEIEKVLRLYLDHHVNGTKLPEDFDVPFSVAIIILRLVDEPEGATKYARKILKEIKPYIDSSYLKRQISRAIVGFSKVDINIKAYKAKGNSYDVKSILRLAEYGNTSIAGDFRHINRHFSGYLTQFS